jgi:NAD(P)-dependent dehydrogenase (short-subunit alcohol dehydrogenase family)
MAKNGIFDLAGKVALVTGGGSGLGRAYCEGLAEFGANVACCDLIEQRAEETVGIISQLGHKAIALKADVSNENDIAKMLHRTVEELGSPDIVFANAGINERTIGVKIHEKPVDDWDHTINVNLRAVFLLMKAVFPHMMAKKAGSFITTASIGGLWPVAIPEAAAYATSKAGVIMLTKVASRQYAADGIRVNSICPGYHRTNLFAEDMRDQIEAAILARMPMKRIAMAREIKGLAVWLASDASSFVTGQIFIEDGGEFA